jgi:hypothetical protein
MFRRPLTAVAAIAGVWALLGCGSPSTTNEDHESPGGGLPGACRSPKGTPNPSRISDVVDSLNELEKPADLPCFLQHLSGPLAIDATVSVLSLQAAIGRRSPRIFILLDPLILSVVPEGKGRDLLELSERRGAARSVKAEITFPVTGEVTHEAPFEHALLSSELTSCAFCHGEETLATDITFTRAFESQAFRPSPSNRVGIDELRSEFLACDAALEPYRCAMLSALFNREGLSARELPASFLTLE